MFSETFYVHLVICQRNTLNKFTMNYSQLKPLLEDGEEVSDIGKQVRKKLEHFSQDMLD